MIRPLKRRAALVAVVALGASSFAIVVPASAAPEPVSTITGSGWKPAAILTLTFEQDAPVTVTVRPNGSFSYLAPYINGERVIIEGENRIGTTHLDVKYAADFIAPTGSCAISADGTSLTVTTTPERHVTATATSLGAVVGVAETSVETSADKTELIARTLTVPLSPAQRNRETVTVTVRDLAQNSSEMNCSAPDSTAPDVTAAINQTDGASISGVTEPGAQVKIFNSDSHQIGSTRAADDGNWSFVLSPALTSGETVSVTATDALGNQSVPVEAIAPKFVVPGSDIEGTTDVDGTTDTNTNGTTDATADSAGTPDGQASTSPDSNTASAADSDVATSATADSSSDPEGQSGTVAGNAADANAAGSAVADLNGQASTASTGSTHTGTSSGTPLPPRTTDALASTGFDSSPMLGLTVLALIGGLLVTAISRRRTS